MPRYRFEFVEHLSDEVVDDIELPGDEAARLEAISTARELMAEGIMDGIDRTGWVSRVFAEDGRLVATVKFSDLIAKRTS